jgi:zinc D-Ala-D-Ala carboxypeptidase
MKLSNNFTLREMEKSQTATRKGIDNKATPEVTKQLTELATNVLQHVRDKWGPVSINSGFRSPALNTAIGGSTTSQHCKGEAADIEVMGLDNYELAKWIDENLKFDQLILEGYDGSDANSGWIHVSWKSDTTNRQKAMTASFATGKAVYSLGINT